MTIRMRFKLHNILHHSGAFSSKDNKEIIKSQEHDQKAHLYKTIKSKVRVYSSSMIVMDMMGGCKVGHYNITNQMEGQSL